MVKRLERSPRRRPTQEETIAPGQQNVAVFQQAIPVKGRKVVFEDRKARHNDLGGWEGISGATHADNCSHLGFAAAPDRASRRSRHSRLVGAGKPAKRGRRCLRRFRRSARFDLSILRRENHRGGNWAALALSSRPALGVAVSTFPSIQARELPFAGLSLVETLAGTSG